jgi:iron complex outermembrane receptor protein
MRTSLATALLLASTALTAPSWAQTAASPTSTPAPATPAASNSTQTVTGGTFGGTLPTDIGRVKAKGETTPSGVTRVDLGGGLMIQEDQAKSRSTVTRDFIAKQASTSNPYQLVEMLPGANINSPDAAGLNGGNITLRGFNSDQIGLTIDGAPVNDSGNYALYPQEYPLDFVHKYDQDDIQFA